MNDTNATMSLLNKPFIPCTPAGSPLVELAAGTEERAWKNLEAQLCPGMYADRKALKVRGYDVARAFPEIVNEVKK